MTFAPNASLGDVRFALNASLGDVRADAEAARWYRHESSRSLSDRVAALEIAERLHARRVQELAVREDVLHRALQAAPRGPMKDWEKQVDEYIRRALEHVEPHVSTSNFVKELEGRAVQLEYSLYHVRQRLASVEKLDRELSAREARVAEREREVSRERASHESVWNELQSREALVSAHEEELREFETELEAWSRRLQARQTRLLEKEGAEGVATPTHRPSNAADKRAAEGESTLEREARLVEVADYLRARHDAIQEAEEWVRIRCQALEEATARLHTLHVRVDGTDSPPAPPVVDPMRDDVHPFLQLFARKNES